MAPQVLQLQEIEPPAELAAALSPDFLDRLGIASLPPVRIAVPPAAAAWRGYCSDGEFAERGEVVIADWRLNQEWRVTEGIQEVYVHETAHRLTWQTDKSADAHGIEFFGILLFLLTRAGEKRGGSRPWVIFWKGYDCQNCLEPRGVEGVKMRC